MKKPAEKGPFRATQWEDGEIYVASQDFRHDVVLHVTGDFGGKATALHYAEWVASVLTRAAEVDE